MILFADAKLPPVVYVGVTTPEIQFVNVRTGEISNRLETLEQPGALFVFSDLPDALENLALKLSEQGTLEIYGDSLSAAWWRIGSRGVRLTGLQGYGAAGWDLARTLDFWNVLTEICNGVGTAPGATPGSTALRIVANTSPRRLTAPGDRTQEFSKGAYSAGARHARSGRFSNAYLYDLHSAFPFSMRRRLPFGEPFFSRRDCEFSISRLTFDYDSHLEFSPLWVRAQDHKVYHPVKAKDLTLTLNSIDLETLERHGRLKIKKVHERLAFECEALLAPAQDYLAEWQKRVPAFRSQIKIIRNSIYGKLAQQATQKRYTLKRIKNVKDAVETKNLWREYNGYEFGLFRHHSTSKPFTHFAAAGAITAHVRGMVYDALDANSIAVRTDAILSRRSRDDLDRGFLDGQWALKETGPAIVFGDSGFIVADQAHLDGVQQFEDGQAATARRAKFAFGESRELVEWRPAIEPRQTVTVKGRALTVQRGRVKNKVLAQGVRGL